jgi:hypothetical protein
MRKKASIASTNGLQPDDPARTATEEMERYCAAHWGSPSAVRRPRLFIRSGLWIALLGPTVEEGIVGIGATVGAALRSFDAQYLAGLRPPGEATRVRPAPLRTRCAS